MAALVAGVQYGLSSQENLNDKSLIYVKLTDSAYRAIEDYIRNKSTFTTTPTIQFHGNEGHLSLPSSQPARGETGFNFSLYGNEEFEAPQGSFECVQQSSNKLENFGSLHCKMRFQANEDIYDTTRKKMAAADQSYKRNCTREIELDKRFDIGRRVKNQLKMVTGGRINLMNRRSMEKQQSSPTLEPHNTSVPHKNNFSDIIKRPLRDRLIHMLAVRPYKKPEICMALAKEGIKPKDKDQIHSTLLKIALVKDNTYHLIRYVWNDVREDWPFYTEQDRQILKRRKPQNLTPPGSSDGGSSVGSGQSPSSVHPGSPPSTIETPSASKRPGYYDGADGLPTKRQRISHYRPSSSNRNEPVPGSNCINYKGPGEDGGGGNYVNKNNTFGQNQYSGSPGVRWSPNSMSASMNNKPAVSLPSYTRNYNNMSNSFSNNHDLSEETVQNPSCATYLSSVNSSLQSTTSPLSPSLPTSLLSSSYCSPSAPANSADNSFSNGNMDEPEPKYVMEYPRIETLEQRRQYKQNFNGCYLEYKNLHKIVEGVSQKFVQLEQRLRREVKNSDAWKAIKEQIYYEYELVNKDKKHLEAKQRFMYLHHKLSYIKRQVMEFDKLHTNPSNRS